MNICQKKKKNAKDKLYLLLKSHGEWVETKTNKDQKIFWKSYFLAVHAGGWDLTQSRMSMNVFLRSSHLEMDNFSSLTFQVMKKAASNFNPSLKRKDLGANT